MRIILMFFLLASFLPLTAEAKVGSGGPIECGPTVKPLVVLKDNGEPDVKQDEKRSITICVPEDASTEVRIGGAGLTLTRGLPVGGKGQKECYSAILLPRERLYCVASSTVTVDVQESTSW